MKFVKFGWLLLAFICLVFALTSKTHAGSLTIQPLRQELELKPGQTVTNKLTVRNTSATEQKITFKAENFSIINENYDYGFSEAEYLEKWVHFDTKQITLGAGLSKIVTYTIGAPTEAEPGGRYIALFATVDGQVTSDNVKTVERAGLLLYITIPGQISKKGSVIDIKTPLLISKRNVDWRLRIRSSGSTHFKNRTTVQVKTIFGKTITEYSDDHLILPNTIRLVSGNAALGRLPGVYKLHFLVGQGDDPAHSSTHWVILMPLYMYGLLGLVAVWFFGSLARRHKDKRRQN